MRKTIIIKWFLFLLFLCTPTYLVYADTPFLKTQLSSVPITDGQYMVVYVKSVSHNWTSATCQYPGNPASITEDSIEYIEPQTKYNSYNEAKAFMDTLTSTSDRVASIIGYRDARYSETGKVITIIDSQYALLDLNVKKAVNGTSGSSFTTDVFTDSFGTGYISGSYGADAAFLSYNSTNTRAKMKMSGLVGYMDRLSSEYVDGVGNIYQLNYKVLPISVIKSPNYYYVSSGVLYHRIADDLSWYNCYSSTLALGPAPSYLSTNTTYYSYDGNYFYTSLMNMLDDYKLGVYTRAINSNDPFYNYYQYLPYRTLSSYTGIDINNYITVRGYTSKPTVYPATYGYQSMLVGEGDSFVTSQNYFGANAMLTFSLSINESGWGRSRISIEKNNIFGHGASDSNPYANAGYYSNVKASIDYHSDTYVSAGYADPTDWRYFGSHFGNKASGMNVKYASDPYWGEKMASHYYYFDVANGMGDYGKYKVGIKNTGTSSLNVRKDPNTSSSAIYQMKNANYGVTEMPVVILDTVAGETVEGSNIWYKIQTDANLDQNRNMISSPEGLVYNFNNNYGYVHASYIKLLGTDVPSITAHDKTILQGSIYNPLDDVLAYDKVDGDITNKVQVTTNTVNTTVPGLYNVTYSVTNNALKTVTLSIKITVRSNTQPVINASSVTMNQSEYFEPLNNVSATDAEDGNITSRITVSGTVNEMVVGVYPIIYSVTDNDNNTVTKTIDVTVNRNENPIIWNATNKTIDEGNSIDLLEGVIARDAEDGIITNKIQVTGDVNTSVPGVYPIAYSVTDNDSHTTTKNINITVTATYQEVGGNFYLHSFNFDSSSNKFNISGYLAIKNMNNTYAQTINYEYTLENVDTGKKYTLSLERWTQGEAYPIKAISEGNYDYTASWFRGSVNLSSIPQGDYVAYVIAKSNGKKATAIFRNTFSREIVRKSTASNGRGYLFRTNYYLKTIPIEIFIRDNGLISSVPQPTSFDNMFNSYRRLSVINNNGVATLSIKGTSFNIMGDYATNQSVERSIIFENTGTFARTTLNLGYIDNANTGNDAVTLRIPDGRDKTRSWFDNNINISSLSAGKYAIFIRTKSGSVDDYGELNDISYRNMSSQITIDNKTYKLSLNQNKRARIELEITE